MVGASSAPRLCHRLGVLPRVHHGEDSVDGVVELLGLLRVDVVPGLLDGVDLHVGGRAGLPDPLPAAAVHPRPGAVDEGDGDGGAEVGGDAGEHGALGPAKLKLHAEEGILTSKITKKQKTNG